VVIKG